ncbi:MAG: hypothetical protein AB8B54_06785 [Sphingorhabdus sp.]
MRLYSIALLVIAAIGFAYAPAQAQTACGGLGQKACFESAISLLKQADKSKSLALQAFQKFDALCDMKNAQSCKIAAEVARDTLKDTQKELKLYAKNCDAGFPQHCGAAMLMTQQISAPEYNLTLARQYAVKGCKNKDAYLCFRQGDLHAPFYDYPDSDVNGQLAQEGFYLACRFGKGVKNISEEDRSRACHSAYFMGTDQDRLNPNQDYRVYGIKQDCIIGDMEACDRAVYGFNYGRMGLKRNVENAGLVAEHMCVKGKADACGQAAKIWRDDGQNERAVMFADLLCKNYPTGDHCAMPFHIVYGAKGANAPETLKAGEKACALGSGDACWYLATNGGYEYSRTGSNKVFVNACKFGIQQMCEYIAGRKENFAIEDRNKEIRKQNAANARASREAQARERRQSSRRASGPSWNQYVAAGSSYWSNWKPSYCSNYTRGSVTSKAECLN